MGEFWLAQIRDIDYYSLVIMRWRSPPQPSHYDSTEDWVKYELNYAFPTTTLLLLMSITLTPQQEQIIQAQLASGRYTNVSEIIADALRLLEKRDRYNHWVEEVCAKIDIAAEQLDRGEGVDGETAIAQIRAKFHHGHQV